MTDVLTDVGLGGDGDNEPPDVDPVAPGEERTDLFVCDVVVDGAVCGATFSDANRLRLHGYGKHRDRTNDRKGGRPKGSTNAKKATGRKTAADKAPSTAASKATGQSNNRSVTYTQSIAMAGLGLYLVAPAFDNNDLAVVNAGAQNLGNALASLAEQNPNVRRACDLILGGGAGGAYLQVLMAVSAIVVPIAANHGVVPETAGARFGEQIGVRPVHTGDGPDVSHPTPPTQAGASGPLDPTNPDDVLAFMSNVPENVMFDLAGRMMNGGGQTTVVEVPFAQNGDDLDLTRPTEGDTSESGSEQLAPVLPDGTAAPEPWEVPEG